MLKKNKLQKMLMAALTGWCLGLGLVFVSGPVTAVPLDLAGDAVTVNARWPPDDESRVWALAPTAELDSHPVLSEYVHGVPKIIGTVIDDGVETENGSPLCFIEVEKVSRSPSGQLDTLIKNASGTVKYALRGKDILYEEGTMTSVFKIKSRQDERALQLERLNDGRKVFVVSEFDLTVERVALVAALLMGECGAISGHL